MLHVNPLDKKAIGKMGEDVAVQFLEQKGFSIIARNFFRAWGEIDVIALKSGIVRFVEVKTLSFERIPDISRENNDYRPEEQVHKAKLHKVARTAEMYMNETNDSREYQIDVIGVFLEPRTKKALCRLLERVG